MAEAILFGLARKMIENLGSQTFQDFGSLWGVEGELEKLKDTVSTIKAVLQDAAEQRSHNNQVKDWLEKLNDAVYDTDDLLSEFSTEATRRSMESGNKVAKEVRTWLSCSNPLAFRSKMSRKIKAMRQKLNAIAENRKNFHLKEFHVETNDMSRKRETHSFVPGEDVIGRDEDKKAIIDLLFDSNVEENVSVIPIVGIGGLGKTTLAQYVYNDEKVKNNFELKMWVCVSDVFELKSIIEKIIISAKGHAPRSLEMDQLQIELREKIDRKKYLLVLDDIWNEDREKWLNLKNILKGGLKGSKIVITTRSKLVVKITHTNSPCINLKGLSIEQSWFLFEKVAFSNEQVTNNPTLREIGSEIVKMCQGVPLAIKSIGHVLYCKETESEWLFVKNNLLENVTLGNEILPILKLSYDHLPSYLKSCFTYCSLFPKDYEMDKETVIQLWIVQGFVQSSNKNQQLEDVGDEYFKNLLGRSFFEEVETYKGLRYKMHDLIHDLAEAVAGKECRLVSFDGKNINEKNRHVSCPFFPDMSFIETLKSSVKSNKIRTFLQTCEMYVSNALDESMLNTLILSFKHLRALDLHKLKITRVPNSIGKLIHLKYLDLSFNKDIETLPDSITTLLNLQTLKLNGCQGLKELPKDVRKMVSLKHLYNDGCDNLSHMPCGLGQMTSLQTLPLFIVSTSSHTGGLGELNELNNLRGTLEISHLERLEEANLESIVVNLREKQRLEKLILKWYHQDQVDNNEDEKLLENLQPHENLKYLKVHHYKGVKFSSWVSSLTNLVDLRIENCKRCRYLPPLSHFSSLKSLNLDTIENCKRCRYLPPLSHLSSLKSLRLDTMNDLEYISDNDMSKEVPASSTTLSTPFFQSLKSLTIQNCPNLKGWWGRTGRDLVATTSASTPDHQQDQSHNSLPLFPLLSYLWISNCPKMTSMPLFPNLEESLYLKNVSLKPLQETMSMTLLLPSSSSSFSSSSLINLVDLSIVGCKRCRYLPPLSHLPSLKSLVLHSMNDLEYISDNDMSKEVHASSATLSTTFFPSLKSLRIEKCPNLKGWWGRTGRDLVATSSASTPDHQQDQSHNSLPSFPLLSYSEISDCPKMTSMPLFPNLEENLRLENVSLKPLQETMSMTFLVPSSSSSSSSFSPLSKLNYMTLRSIEDIESLPAEWALYSLKELRIWDCPRLTSMFGAVRYLTSLYLLSIEYCEEFDPLRDMHDDGMEWRCLICLSSLTLKGIPKLKSLPVGLQCISTLKKLVINSCPNLMTLPELTSLEYLEIRRCKPNLTSLLEISCLTSLRSLQIADFPNLITFPESIRNPISLEKLSLYDCPNLTTLPDDGFLKSLQKLYIWACPQLLKKYKNKIDKDFPDLEINWTPFNSY